MRVAPSFFPLGAGLVNDNQHEVCIRLFRPCCSDARADSDRVIHEDGTSPSGAMIEHQAVSFLRGVGGASLNRNP